MRQYLDVKSRYPDAIVLFRFGDFYEMFYDDAVYAARVLDLTLTTRDKGKEDPVPMCGVPHHAVRSYLGKLTELGHRVALCEQLEDPKVARGIVKRDVVRVITPGVVLDEEALDPRAPSYVAAAVGDARGGYGFAFLDVTTGDFRATEAPSADALLDEIGRVAPRELVLGRSDADRALAAVLRPGFPRLPRAAVDDGDPAVELARAFGAAFDVTLLERAPLAAAAAAASCATRAPPSRARAAARRPAGLRAPTSCHRRAGARPPRADRVAAGSPARRLAHRSARRDTLGDGRAPAASLAALSVGRARRDPPPPGRGRAAGRRARRPRRARKQLDEIADLERLVGRARLGVATPRDLAVLGRSLAALPALADALAEAHAGEIGGSLAGEADLLRLRAETATMSWSPSSRRSSRAAAPGRAGAHQGRRLRQRRRLGRARRARRHRQRRAQPDRRHRDARARAHRHPVAQGQVQQRLRLLHRGDALAPAAPSRPTTAASRRSPTPSASSRPSSPSSRRRSSRPTSAASPSSSRSSPRCATQVAGAAERLLALGARVAAADALAALAEVAHRNGYCRPVVDDAGVIDLADSAPPRRRAPARPPAASSPTTSASIPPPSRS